MENSTKTISTYGLSGTALKILALILMIIDHVTLAFFGGTTWYIPGRLLGRIAFPVFCFLLVEGYRHTRSIRKYAGRLFLFALISEIPFDYALLRQVVCIEYQNVFFTLFFGVLIMACYDIAIDLRIRDDRRLQHLPMKQKVICRMVSGGAVFLLPFTAWIFHTDYDAFGVILILIMHIGWEKMHRNDTSTKSSIAENTSGTLRNYYITTAFPSALTFFVYVYVSGYTIELFGLTAFILIGFYNGKRGDLPIPSILFYAVYPLHLLLIGILESYFLLR